jgi:transcriptional regulator with XRE-family HTH domain
MIKDKKVPNPIDRHVGSRVRMRRVMLGMSQEKLGDSLGLTFQQVQKYEKGTNRIGASRLQQISRTLDVPPAFFFEGAPMLDAVPREEATQQIGVAEEASSSYVSDFLSTSEGLHLNMAFARIQDAKVRKRIIDLVVALAEGEQQPDPVTHEPSNGNADGRSRFPDDNPG